MADSTPPLDHAVDYDRPPEARWLNLTAAAFVLGIALGRVTGHGGMWMLTATAVVLFLGLLRRRLNQASWQAGCYATVFLLGGVWITAHDAANRWSGADLSRYLQADGALAELEGRVVVEPVLSEGTSGPFAAYGYESPTTRFELDVERIHTEAGWRETRGVLIVKIDEADHRLQLGQRLRVRGWLAPISGPLNPGDFDYAAHVAERGVVGRLQLANRGNWHVLDTPSEINPWWSPVSWVQHFQRLRAEVAERAAWSLGLGLGDRPQTLGLLQTLLLGQTTEDIDTLRDRFREVGLAHLLSISGAHLGILMGLVWCVTRLLVPHPSRAAMWVLVILGLYLLAVPLRVPIVRASIMAGVYFAGVASGRRPGATTLLSLAALIALVWRPGDLFDAGFQLSFVTVWALLRFVEPVSKAIWPEPMIAESLAGGIEWRAWVARRAADYAAVSVVATATAMPLVAYHFQMINPMSVVLSVLALPVLTAVLALGYLKVILGLVLPSGSLMLSGPLGWVGQSLSTLVEEAASWPGATVRLVAELPMWWVAVAIGVGWLWMAGRFSQRRVAGGLALLVVVGYVALREQPEAGRWLRGEDPAWATPPSVKSQSPTQNVEQVATLSMLAVGDGSCFVLRSGEQTMVFDCGSQAYPLIGRRSVVPTLRKMGIDRVDVLVISHADLDHYNGALDLLDAMPVGEVWASADVFDDARQHPDRATAFLVTQLAERGHTPRVMVRGDKQKFGEAQLDVLWPPAEGWEHVKSNGRSIVMSVRVAGRRLLLNGDIPDAVMSWMLETEQDLTADVTDLPHHGSFVDASPRWLDAVRPRLVLQSSGPARLRRDKWEQPLAQRGIPRRVSDRDGMTQVWVDAEGGIVWRSFLETPDVAQSQKAAKTYGASLASIGGDDGNLSLAVSD